MLIKTVIVNCKYCSTQILRTIQKAKDRRKLKKKVKTNRKRKKEKHV